MTRTSMQFFYCSLGAAFFLLTIILTGATHSNSIQAQNQQQTQEQSLSSPLLSPSAQRGDNGPISSGTEDLSLDTSNDSFSSNESTVEPLMYRSPQYNLSIQYPSDWSYEEYEPSPGAIAYPIVSFFPPVTEDPNFTTQLTITIENLDFPITPDQYARDSVNYYRGNIQNFSLSSVTTEDTYISGIPAYEIVFTEDSDGAELKTYEKGTIDGERVYYLTFTSPLPTYDQVFPVAETMIDTFALDSSLSTSAPSEDLSLLPFLPEDSFSGLGGSEAEDMQQLELFMDSFANSIFNGSSVFAAVGTSMVDGIRVSGISFLEEGPIASQSNNSIIPRLTVTVSSLPGYPQTELSNSNSSVTVIAMRIPLDLSGLLSLAELGSAAPPSFSSEDELSSSESGMMRSPFSPEGIPDDFNPFEFLSTFQIGSTSLVNPDWSVPQSVSMSLVGSSSDNNGNLTGTSSSQPLSFTPPAAAIDIIAVTVIPYTGIVEQLVD